MKKNKEITIDELATMVQKGFESIEVKMDKRFEKVEKKIEGVDDRLSNVESKVNQIDRRLFSIEEDVADIKIKQYGDLNKRVHFIERKLGISNA